MRHLCQRRELWMACLALLGIDLWSCSINADELPRSVQAAAAAEATSEKEMHAYTEKIHGTDVKFEMVPIPGGELTIGSPDGEAGRKPDEGPQRRVKLDPFWMGRCEVTWNEFDLWMLDLDRIDRKKRNAVATKLDLLADTVTRPSKPYTDPGMGMGHDSFPVICMTQRAAKTYCEWLSAKTGHYYRLPTEAEWEYACRAGTTTAYSFGDDPSQLGDFAWYAGNSNDTYHKVGQKKPNPWGLYDMHGNVAEWTLDEYLPDAYARLPATGPVLKPFFPPSKLYPHSVRGGSWDQTPEQLRSATRMKSDPIWKVQDPQDPRSPWYQIDAIFVGFRIVRPLVEDSAVVKIRYKGTGDLLPDR